MPNFSPSTNALADAIAAYLQNMVYSGTSTPVYSHVQKGRKKDVSDLVPPNGTNVIAEVYGNLDDSQRHTLGGKMRDTQSFFVLSIVDMTDGNVAETLIMNVRDAIMPTFAQHVQLGGAGNALVAKYKQGSGRFLPVFRSAKDYRAHLMELLVVSDWNASPSGFTS